MNPGYSWVSRGGAGGANVTLLSTTMQEGEEEQGKIDTIPRGSRESRSFYNAYITA